MKVRIKKLHPDSVIPQYSKPGDAGLDLTAIDDGLMVHESVTGVESYMEYSTGLAIEIPEGFVGLIYPRSSITSKALMLKNAVGVVDSSYRGPIKLRFARFSNIKENLYSKGDRIGQLIIIPIPKVELVEVSELSETDRGAGGFGHTGN